MKNTNIKSSILLSIFKRKGGEGILTKIITDSNRTYYNDQLKLLKESEEALISFKEDDLNWLILTNRRVIERKNERISSIYFSDFFDVNIAMQEEFKVGVENKKDFTRLLLKDNQGNNHLLKLENGLPFQGIYQIFHHIRSNNKL